MSDYLWDKSGAPDPEIERLEKLLTPLGHGSQPGRGPLPTLPSQPIWNRAWVPVAMAASMLMVVCGSWLSANRNRTAWQVSSLQGQASVSRLARGESLKTDAASRAKLELDAVGEVEIEPNSQLTVVTLGRDEQRLDLQRGTIHATIWAPPGQFFVNTPSAVTVDLGCAYTLQVDGSGAGKVKVTAGWVAFESNGRESFIPATAQCVTRPGKGPGIPYYQDSEQVLQRAVDRFDSSADASAIPSILGHARRRDAISLWHLLRRVPAVERGAVYDRLAQLITIPADVSRAGVVSGDAAMTDALWNSLDLGDTGWWRMWKSRLR